MDKAEYQQLADRETVFWWHIGRRRILASILERLHLPAAASILEVGSGTGGNLPMLSKFGRMSAMEFDPGARQIAEAATGIPVSPGALPDDLPFSAKSFDLVVAFDVIEHIDDDKRAVETLFNTTRPGGWFVSTVPAYNWMWSEHDVLLHHKRRYTRGPYTSMIESVGFDIHRSSYFNTFLFPLAVGIRVAQSVLGISGSAERSLPRPWINRMLTCIFSTERVLLGHVAFPFGMSILVAARKPMEPTKS